MEYKLTRGGKSVIGKKELIKKMLKSRLTLLFAMTALFAFFLYEFNDKPQFRNWAVIVYAVAFFLIILDLCGKTDDVKNEDIEIVDAFVLEKRVDTFDDSDNYYITLYYGNESEEKRISVRKDDYVNVDESEKCFIIKNENDVLAYYSQKRFTLDAQLRKLYKPTSDEAFKQKREEHEQKIIQEEKEFEEWVKEYEEAELAKAAEKEKKKKAKGNASLKQKNTAVVFSTSESCEHDFSNPETCSHDYLGYDKETNVIHAANTEKTPNIITVVLRIIRIVVLWAVLLFSLLCTVVSVTPVHRDIPMTFLFGSFTVISLLMIFTKLKNLAFLYITAFFSFSAWLTFADVESDTGVVVTMIVLALLTALPAILGNVLGKKKRNEN